MSLAIPMCQTKYGFAIVSQYYLCLLSDLTKYGFVIVSQYYLYLLSDLLMRLIKFSVPI